MTAQVTIGEPGGLAGESYEAIVYRGAAVVIAPEALARVAASRDLFERHIATGVLCYGVNTGLGALAGRDLGPAEQAQLSRRVLMGRAAAVGVPFPPAVARGMLLIRLVQFLSGEAAVTPGLCRHIALCLDHGLAPWVPSEGHGMAGEIIPLCHLAQPLIGEGLVHGPDGRAEPARDWYRRQGLAPWEPRPKEGIALINGVAAAPAIAWHRIRRLRRTRDLADGVAAASIEALALPLEPFDPAVARLRPDPGLAETLAALAPHLAGSAVTRSARQGPVSFRVVPQVHGVLRDALDGLAVATLREMATVGDNPAFIGDPDAPAFGRLLHGGNFHAAALTHAVEGAALALIQVGLLAERRLHRLLDARFTGLAPQLARDPGLDAGLVTLHKAALGFSARLKAFAVPPSILHGESSFGQEDAMALTLPALDRLGEVERLVRAILAYELTTACVALDQRGERAGDGVERLRAAVRAVVPAYEGDRSYGPEVERVLGLLDEEF